MSGNGIRDACQVYADALERSVDSLEPIEKQQAVLNHVLSGRPIDEPGITILSGLMEYDRLVNKAVGDALADMLLDVKRP